MNAANKRKPRRTNAQIDADVMNAMTRLVENPGFGKITMLSLVKEAGIDPNIFYRRYGTMDKLYKDFINKADFWIRHNTTNLIELKKTGPRQYYKDTIVYLINTLMDNRILTNFLAWELCDDSEITSETAQMREMQHLNMIAYYSNYFKGTDVDINSVTACIAASLFYLVLHKDKSTFCTIDINKEEDKERLIKALHYLVDMVFDKVEERNLKAESIKRMLADGITPQKIRQYLDMSAAEYKTVMSACGEETTEQ